MRKIIIIILMLICLTSLFGELLVPMDMSQVNHLKAYGIAFKSVKEGQKVKWLLNYRGGAFIMNDTQDFRNDCNIRGVSFEIISGSDIARINEEINANNMEVVTLEKEPRIAVYTPPNTNPWDDAVTLALTYAEIDYDKIWDEEVITGKLADYDWLHLHHEDFTGQYGKFYGSYRNAPWYINEVKSNEQMAQRLGYKKVWELKHQVANKIREFVINGGFLFAMCGATDTIDIALACNMTDICDAVFDGDGIDPQYKSKMDFSRTFAFEKFDIMTNPYVYEFSSVDASDYAQLRGVDGDYFQLFDFSAKYDPVPTMLIQNHTNAVNGFLGQTTSFRKAYLKNSVIILGETPNADEAKYIHGNMGKGTFTFYGGHDPEDYQHKIGDPETVLDLHKNSAGYRLILNNVLFPAAEKKKLKT